MKRLLPKGTKVGHTGTLDPLASGLLVLLLGRATRLSRYVTSLDKTYTATAAFGAVSDTLDSHGSVTPLEGVREMPDEAAIRAAAERLTGDILQRPPMASAVKVGGERLYKALRRGEEVERESRPVTVHALDLLALDPAEKTATFHVSCGSGTYVRSLVSDLAELLGTGAYLTALRRTSVGHLSIENATPPEDRSPKALSLHIIQMNQVVAHLPVVEVGAARRRAVCSGRVALDAFALDVCGDGVFRVELGGELLAVYRGDGGEGASRPEVVLCDP